jgi:hypothetical protein
MTGAEREDLFTFMIISHCILLGMTSGSEKIVEKIKIQIFVE